MNEPEIKMVYHSPVGENVEVAIYNAIKIAKSSGIIVSFEFNGRVLEVNKMSSVEGVHNTYLAMTHPKPIREIIKDAWDHRNALYNVRTTSVGGRYDNPSSELVKGIADKLLALSKTRTAIVEGNSHHRSQIETNNAHLADIANVEEKLNKEMDIALNRDEKP